MIPIQNIYYMLSYAFQVLQEQGYRSVAAENFQNTSGTNSWYAPTMNFRWIRR